MAEACVTPVCHLVPGQGLEHMKHSLDVCKVTDSYVAEISLGFLFHFQNWSQLIMKPKLKTSSNQTFISYEHKVLQGLRLLMSSKDVKRWGSKLSLNGSWRGAVTGLKRTSNNTQGLICPQAQHPKSDREG